MQGSLNVVGNQAQSGASMTSITALNGSSRTDSVLQADVAVGSTGSAGLISRYAGSGDSNMYLGALVGANGVYTAGIWRNLAGTWTQLAAVTVAGGSGTLQFDTVGTSLQLFWNNALVASATDASLSSGAVGLRSVNQVTFDNFSAGNPVPPAAVSLPFSDAFASNGVLSPYWATHVGSFTIAGGDVQGTKAAVSLATLNGVNQADVGVQADVSLNSATSIAGLVTRYSGPGDSNMYLASLKGSNGVYTASISRNLKGVWTVLSSATVSSGSGTLRFETVGTSLKLFLNGQLLTYAYDSKLTSGSVGVRGFDTSDLCGISTRPRLAPVMQTLPFSDNFTNLGRGSRSSAAAPGRDRPAHSPATLPVKWSVRGPCSASQRSTRPLSPTSACKLISR